MDPEKNSHIESSLKKFAVCILVAVCAVCGAGRRRQGFLNRRVPFSCRVRRVFRRVSRRVSFSCRVSPCAAVCAVCRRVSPCAPGAF